MKRFTIVECYSPDNKLTFCKVRINEPEPKISRGTEIIVALGAFVLMAVCLAVMAVKYF